MTSVSPDWDLDTTIAAMQRHGYQGLEPRVEWGHKAGIEAAMSAKERAAVRGRFADEGLEICCIASGVRLAVTDATERQRHLDDARRCIALAADLGTPLLRTFGGPRTESWQLHHYVEHVLEGYTSLLPEAEAAGVTILLETHDDWSCSAPVRAVVERAAHGNLRVLWDLMHPQRMLEDVEQTFAAVGKLTAHVHGHDGAYAGDDPVRMQPTPLGAGAIEHERPLRLLADAGYDGYFSIEVIQRKDDPHDPEEVLRQHAAWFTEHGFAG